MEQSGFEARDISAEPLVAEAVQAAQLARPGSLGPVQAAAALWVFVKNASAFPSAAVTDHSILSYSWLWSPSDIW